MLTYATIAFVVLATSQLPETDFGSVERVVSYIGLLAMGWFFWRRETTRTDKSIDELKAENDKLRRDIKELEKDMRSLLSHRETNDGFRRSHLWKEEDDG